MSTPPIKVALLGAGYIASWHADAIKRISGVEVAAICDVSGGAAESLAAAYNVPHIFTSLEDLLAAKVVDCVHVLTPPHIHADVTEQILNAGLAAFVEKPFTLSSQDCQKLDALATANNTPLGINHNFLMLPSYDRLKADIKAGTIGAIDSFEANWQFPLTPLRSGPYALWMLRKPENLLFELGPHLFAFLADLFGEISDVSVDLRNPITIPGGITHFQSWRINARSGNTSITLNLSLIEGHDNRSVRVRGLGALAQYDFAEDTYRCERASMADIVAGPMLRQFSVAGQAVGAGVSNAVRQLKTLNAHAPYGLSMYRAIESFYQSVRDKAPIDKRLSAELATNATRMIEAALEKARPQFVETIIDEKPPAHADKGKTMLVIGGTGFIGRALCNALVEQGYHVRVMSRGSGGGIARADGRISVVTGSLKSDTDLQTAMHGVDGVFHLAKATETSWQGYLENDVNVTRRIGEACIAAGVRRLVYTGTIDSYDASQAERPISEATPFDHDLERRNLYARSKAACEAALKELETDRALPLVIARPGIVIGKGGPLQHWGIAMWRGATTCKIWGDGKNIMPFVLVDDVADGLVLTMEAEDVEGQSFNLIGDPILSAQDYFSAIEQENGVTMNARPTPIWTYFTIDVVKYWLKRVLARRQGLTKPSFRDWKSRAQLSPYKNEIAKDKLGWSPEADRASFIQRGIYQANLFGINNQE